MKSKTIVKLAADVLMTLALLLLMGYQFWGTLAHEWIGTGMLLLFISHHLLNLSWHKRLFKGKYTPERVLTLCVDALLLLAMVALMCSGIALSRHVFAFLPFEANFEIARKLHILGSYWGFLLMSLHLGLHWSMVLGWLGKTFHAKPTGEARAKSIALFVVAACVAAYGVHVLVSRDFATYLFLQSEFVFFDYSEPVALFYLDYLAVMGLCIFVAHYGKKLCRKFKR